MKQLADLFSISFLTGVFLSVLKTANYNSLLFLKDSELDYSNSRAISVIKYWKETYAQHIVHLNNIIIYSLRQYYTFHASIDITKYIRKTLDDGVVVDLQKAFDAVHYQIMLVKLNHYGIRGVSND